MQGNFPAKNKKLKKRHVRPPLRRFASQFASLGKERAVSRHVRPHPRGTRQASFECEQRGLRPGSARTRQRGSAASCAARVASHRSGVQTPKRVKGKWETARVQRWSAGKRPRTGQALARFMEGVRRRGYGRAQQACAQTRPARPLTRHDATESRQAEEAATGAAGLDNGVDDSGFRLLSRPSALPGRMRCLRGPQGGGRLPA